MAPPKPPPRPLALGNNRVALLFPHSLPLGFRTGLFPRKGSVSQGHHHRPPGATVSSGCKIGLHLPPFPPHPQWANVRAFWENDVWPHPQPVPLGPAAELESFPGVTGLDHLGGRSLVLVGGAHGLFLLGSGCGQWRGCLCSGEGTRAVCVIPGFCPVPCAVSVGHPPPLAYSSAHSPEVGSS